MKFLIAAPRALTPLALAAAVLAIVAPSTRVADHSDLLLAALVLVTALGITATELRDDVRRHRTSIAVLSVAPLIVLSLAAWAIGRLFDQQTRDGLLAVGAASSEVAIVGLVTLAGADATIALGALAGSLVMSALLGPVMLGVLAAHAGHGGTAHLLGRFALVVIAPLIAGVAVRSAQPRLQRWDRQREGVAALAVVALVYAALSGTAGTSGLGAALAASVAFLAVSAALGELWRRATPRPVAVPGALCIGMRDFAVAAALASQAFGSAASAVPGVYGVVMLLAGSAAAGLAARAGVS
ncbi:MAG: bile acid:sodium symporter [Solirubrobacteraceae bacterium]